MFSKKLAGIGAVAALVGSALLPSVALAAPGDDNTNYQDVQTGLEIVKTIQTNSDINIANSKFIFDITEDPCTNGTPTTDTACKTTGYPTLTTYAPEVTFTQGATEKRVNFPLPEATAFTGGPGIYVWKVVERQNTATGHAVGYSLAEYRVKAYVVKNADTGVLEYKAVTVAQDKDNVGTDVTENNKVGALAFENIYKDLTTLQVAKTVEGDGQGLDELSAYAFTVNLTYPSNFTPSATNGGVAPAVTGAVANSVSGNTVGTTQIKFSLAKGGTATISNLPVGTTYTVTEDSTGSFTTKLVTTKNSSLQAAPVVSTKDFNNKATDATTLGDNGNTVAVTNKYDDVTPTGVVLAVLPYVLMIGIPLLAIAGYIALRRKMNL